MATLVTVHGAGSGPGIFDDWRADLAPIEVSAVDLQHGVDVATASMSDYAGAVARAIRTHEHPVALCGWSMGGLVAAMATLGQEVDALVLIEPSPPAQVQGYDSSIRIETGTFDPVKAYGPFPSGINSRRESVRARCERKRGISIPALPERTLVVYGDEFPEERGRSIATHYACDERYIPGADHWELVTGPRARRVVADYLRAGGFTP